jgi:hypothetical protein
MGAPQTAGGDTATQVFAEHRELLFSIVYTMLGSVAEGVARRAPGSVTIIRKQRPG